MSPEISQHNLPGIGRSYKPGRDGSEVLAALHNSGRRDLYVSANPDHTPERASRRTTTRPVNWVPCCRGRGTSSPQWSPGSRSSDPGGLLIEPGHGARLPPAVERSIAESRSAGTPA